MKLLSNTRKGEIYAASSGLLYGLIGYFGVQIINAGNTIPNMMFWRCLVAMLIAAVIFYVKHLRARHPRAGGDPKTSDLLKVFIYGAIFYSPCTIIWFNAAEHIGTGLAMVIFFTYPAIVVIINKFFYKTSISPIYYFSIFIIFIGMICIADLGEATFSITGIMLGLLSAFGYGCYVAACRNISKLDPILSTIIVSLGCTFTAAIFAIIDGSFTVPQGISTWGNIFGMALISTALPILLLLEAMKYISSTKASILSVLEPVAVVIFGILLLDETVSIMQGIGVVVVLGGALLTLKCKRE